MSQPAACLTIVVTSASDAGTGTLRDAIAQANTSPGADVIEFDAGLAGQTITLTSGLGADQLTISGNNSSRVFYVYNSSANITVAISDLSIVDGNAETYGGGIFNDEILTVTNTRLDNNSTFADIGGAYGGGIANYDTLTVTNSTLTNNWAMSYGGALSNFGTLTVTNTTLAYNSVTNLRGGGIHNQGTLTVTDSTLAYNSAARAGAIFNYYGTGTITNTTLVYNSTGSYGGGIENYIDSTLTVINSTLAYNSTPWGGGGIYNQGSLTVANSLVGGNTGSTGPDIRNEGTVAAQYNIIQDGAGSGIVDGVNGNQVGVDPLLDPAGLQDNGGPTQTIALLPESPALDTGSNAEAVGSDGQPLDFDQRGPGFPRILNGIVDVGAFEAWHQLMPDFNWSPPTPKVGGVVQFTDQSTGDPTSWSWDFGDGATSSAQHPTHVFQEYGSYTVTLVVTNVSGQDQVSRTLQVPPSGPSADFSWSPEQPQVGDTVTFEDLSSGAPVAWSWDIGADGSWEYSEQSPSHTFSTEGLHPVTLWVGNAYGTDQITMDLYVQPAGWGTPSIVGVTREYPGFFLDGTDVENEFQVTVDWRGTNPGYVRFSVYGGSSVDVDATTAPVSHTFDMANDFDAATTPSIVEITAYGTDGGGSQVASQTSTQTVYVFPYPSWLELAKKLDPGAITIVAGDGEVIAKFDYHFPIPHLSETYGRFKGRVSSTGLGELSLFGQTGFRALESAVMGEAKGSGEFRLFPPGGLEITQTSFNLHLEGILSKAIKVTEIPQFQPLTTIPILGSYIKSIGDRAILYGQIAPYLDLTASWSQNDAGDLEFASAEGTLGLGLKAMLTLDLGSLDISAWVAGGGSFTLGLPDPPPLIRAAEVHAQLGIRASLNYRFRIFWKTYYISLSKTAALNLGCQYEYDQPWGCYVDFEFRRPGLYPEEAIGVQVIDPEYSSFGDYAVFRPTPMARTKSSKVPVAVVETKLVENLFPGASPAIVEAEPGILLVWEHDDVLDEDLQSTEIAWSYRDGSVWTEPEVVEDDTRAELSPVVGTSTDGSIVAAWTRIKDPDLDVTIEEVSDLPLFYKQLEVVSATFDPVLRTWSPISQLTDDESMDIDLRLATDPSGNPMLTWLSNPDGEFLSTDTSPSSLKYSFWNGTGFSAPAELAGGLIGVGGHVSAVSAAGAVVLVPRDPDLLTIGDEVIDLYTWDGSAWSAAAPFATGAGGNLAPSVVFDAAGEGHVVWLQGSDLVKATLSDPTPVTLRSGSASLAFLGAQLLSSPGGNITLIWQEIADNQPADIFAMIYDPESDTWSADRRLLDREELVHQVSAVYDSDNTLHAAFMITEIGRTTEIVEISGQEWEMTNIPVEGQSDLLYMRHELGLDLAVDDDDLMVMPPRPEPGDWVTATLTVHNAGDRAIGEFDVELYVGDPDAGGVWVGTQSSLPEWFAAGASLDFEFNFAYPDAIGNLVAVVDSLDEVNPEITEANNRATWYLDNHAPVVAVVADPTSGWVPLTVSFDGSMSYDPDDDTLTHRWSFADGTAGATDVQVTHTFDSDGLYPVTLTATDEHGAVGTAVVVIEVYSGFVTGGGWITSPPGAYPADPSLTGKANFDFAAKYRRGSTVPIGATEFQFQAAGLDFHSTTYEWLVVVGPLAKFKGEGEINGEGGYGFMLSAIDGARPGGGGLDKVRIKIWDKASGMVVYDNQIGAGDDESPTTVIGGGSIVVHRRHRKHSNRMHAAGP
jgi:PKD repeat protein